MSNVSITKKGDFDLDKSEKAYSRFKKRIPKIMANNSVNHFKKSFTNQGGQTNESKGGWKSREFPEGGNTLVQRGTLQKDLQTIRATFNSTLVGTSNTTSEYAEIQNEGGVITVTDKMRKFFWAKYYDTKKEFWKGMALHKGSTVTIPKRNYIGDSDSLDVKNLVSLRKELDKVFNV